MTVLRLVLLAVLAFAVPAVVLAEEPTPAVPRAEAAKSAGGAPKVVRFVFKPPVGGTLAYRVIQRDKITIAGIVKERAWRHVIEVRVTGARPPDLLDGTITLRHVRLDQGPSDDPFYLIAKTLEGRALRAVLHQSGSPAEVDWPRLKPEIAAGLGRHTNAETAGMLAASLGQFDALDGVTAVVRPLFLASVGHLLSFHTDGSLRKILSYNGPGAVMIGGRWAATALGRKEGEPIIIELGWRIGVDPAVAARELGPMLQGLATAAAQPADLPKLRAVIAEQVARGAEMTERASAEYEYAIALMRRITHRHVLATSGYRKEATLEMERIQP